MTTTTLHDSLTATLGAAGLLPGEQSPRYAVDAVVPSAVVQPAGVPQTADIMRLAHAEGLAVTVRGGGTAMALGNPPERLDLVLSMSRMHEIIDHEPADMTVTVQAGTTLEALNQRLAEQGQMVPWDAPNAHRATIGGIVAANQSGPRQLTFGTPRDRLLGLSLVDGEGTLLKCGGKVVKNVAGYDLTKLFVGSLGTLAVIVEATIKVAPLPAAEATIIGAFKDLEPALGVAQNLLASGFRAVSLEVVNGVAYRFAASKANLPGMADRAYFVAAQVAGAPAAVDRQKMRAHGAIVEAGGKSMVVDGPPAQTGFWRALADTGFSQHHPAVMISRSSARYEHLARLIHGHEAIGESSHFELGLVLHAGAGVMRGSWWNETGTPVNEGLLAEAVTTLRKAADIAGGPFVVESCPPSLKRVINVWGEPRPDFPIMRRLKEQFDPRRLLSPGRFVGGL